MKHKFYYNGKLIRTSEHEYTHAVIADDGKLAGCRTSLKAAQSVISSEISRAQKEIENYRKGIKAMESGKNGYMVSFGRGYKFFHTFGEADTVECYQKCIENFEKFIERVNNWKVVELERR